MNYLTFERKQGTNRPVLATLIAISVLTSLGISSGTASAAAGSPTRFYSNTGHSVGGAFLTYFDRFGGVRIFGYPISEEILENGRPVQYFERQRFEYYKEAAGTPNEVQGSRIGDAMARGRVPLGPVPPFTSTPTRVYFKETGHSLSSPFLDFWKNNGDLRIFGYPISELVSEKGTTVQYFERARMEYHPQKAAAGYAVELGQLGKEYVQTHPEAASEINQGQGPSTSTSSSSSSQQGTQGTLSPREQQLMDYINNARRQARLSPVVIDPRITAVSRSRSNDMAARGYFSHTTPEGNGFMQFLKAANIQFTLAGEILATNNYKAEETAFRAYEGFMNSPAHRAIILDPRFNTAGAGEASNSKGFYLFTVIFIQK